MGIITEYLPGIEGINVSGLVGVVTWFILIIIFGIAAGFGTYMYLREKKFNKKIVIFSRVNGNFGVTGKDKAMIVRFGVGGDTVFRLRKSKKFLPTPTIQTGINSFWFYIREDGEWINFGLADLDQKQKEMGARFLDKEVRFARASLQKNLKDRYDAPTFLQKYGGILTYTILIISVGIVIWLWFDKIIQISANIASATETAIDLTNAQKQILAGMDNICTGSGLKAAPALFLGLIKRK